MMALTVEKLADHLIAKKIGKSENRDILIYGIAAGIELLLSATTTAVLGVVFGLFIESLIFLAALIFLRTYACGYHCKSALACYLVSSGIVILVLAIVRFVPTEYMAILSLIALLVAVPILLKFAPIGTPNNPLDCDEKKHYRKKCILHLEIECIIAVLLYLIGLSGNAFIICLSIVVSAGLVLLQKLQPSRGK